MLHLYGEQKRQRVKIKHIVQHSKSIIAYSFPKHFFLSDRNGLKCQKVMRKKQLEKQRMKN